MKKRPLQNFILSAVLILISMTASFAQPGTAGVTPSYFNYVYSSIADYTGFTGGANFTGTVNGNQLIFGKASSTGPTRAKSIYTGAVKCQSVTLPSFASLGYLALYVQNGSSTTNENLFIEVWNNNTSKWDTVETFLVGGNATMAITSNAALSKKGVQVKIDSDGLFWFYNIEARASILASVNPSEAPKILSITPTGGSTITSTGLVNIQFDEIVKSGTGSVTFGGGAVAPKFKGSVLEVDYSGLTGPSNTLTIPGIFVQNNGSINLVKDTSIVYAGDITDPVYQSVSPVSGSNIDVASVTSKIILTFDEPIAKGTGTITFSPSYATITDTAIGNTLVISYTGLAYSTAYTLTIPANRVQDLSGNTYKSVITVSYNTNAKDNTPPTLSSQSVTNGATNVPIGGSIAFTFNEIVQKGIGNVTINGVPATLSFNGMMAGVNYTNLNYSVSNTIVIPSGAITDTTGNAYAGTTFSFTTKPFAAKAFDIIVAKDGSGDFTTIQAAVNSVANGLAQRTFIYVKNGTYFEKILIPAAKQNISLIGQDSAKTIIAYNDYAGAPGLSTDLSYTIDIQSPGFYAENITFKNTWATTGGTTNQAVALMTEGDMQVFKNCKATSFQDTHYPKQPNTRNYYLNCFIEGATDFTFGGATAFFEACIINDVSGGQYNTAPSGTTREFGLVYNNCSITANSNVAAQSFYLGRPWKDFGKTVWLNTKMGPHIKDIGWSQWTGSGPDADNQWTGFYAEYNSMNLSGTPINPTRAAWGQHLTTLQASRYNIDNVFNYGVGQSTWNPLPYSTAPAAPTNVVATGNTLSWTAPAFAVGYVIIRDDTVVVGTTTQTNYTDITASAPTNKYTVKAVNEYGAQSGTSNQVTSIADSRSYKTEFEIYPNPFTDVITLKNSEKLKTLEFFNASGQMIKQTDAAPTIKTSDLNTGLYMVKVITNDGASYYIKMVKP